MQTIYNHVGHCFDNTGRYYNRWSGIVCYDNQCYYREEVIMAFKEGNDLYKRRVYAPGRSWNAKEIVYDVNDNGCWVCTSHPLDMKGYPRVKRNGKSYRMNRYMLQQKLGREIKENHLACHVCNNKQCINPDHLYEGTPLDNVKDMINAGTARGGYMPGETNPNSVLTEDIVRYIKNNTERSIIDLAKEIGVAYNTVWKVRKGLTWGHIL